MTLDGLRAVRQRVDAYPPALSTLLVVALLLPVYLASTNWNQHLINDVVATVQPAHQLATRGTWVVPEVDRSNPWWIEVEGGFVSNRFPGAILHAVPAYAAFGVDGTVTTEPGALTAAVLAAAAMAVLHLVLRRVTTTWRALVGTLVAGLGTSTWGISAAALWTHTPGQLWLTLGVLGLAAETHLRAGLAFGVALLVRPQTAVIAAVAGLARSWQQRDLRPAAWVGTGTAAGLVAYLAYNRIVLPPATGEAVTSVTGGYGAGPLRSLASLPWHQYLDNLAGFLVAPNRGMLLLSPFLAVLVVGLVPAWRAAEPWVRAAALGGLAYLLVQARVNAFHGGADLFVYRLQLEALTVAAPLLAVAYDRGVAGRRARAALFWGATVASVAVQLVAAVWWDVQVTEPSIQPRWDASEWRRAVEFTGPAAVLALAATAAAVGAAVWRWHPARRRT